jgi:4-amino-4-deoxy-L-arabinose transferase-like glycosyltransferase
VLVLVFVLAGLTGHEPWKADEAYVFGIVHELLESGDWIVPRLASGFFMSVALRAVAATARIWWRAGTGRYAALIMIVYVGTLVQSHMMMPDISLLVSFVAKWREVWRGSRPGITNERFWLFQSVR